MDESIQKLIEAYLQKGEGKLASARNLLEDGAYDDSISRSYYAAFHAVQALLQSEGLQAETHRGLSTLFNLHFIKTGKLETKYGKILNNLRDDREEGDYDALSLIDKETAQNALDEAIQFVERTKKYLKGLSKSPSAPAAEMLKEFKKN